jgi:Fe2+ transport system protein FeoA
VNHEALLPLDLLTSGEWADVAEVTGEPGWVCRMAEMGVRTGCRLCMLQSGSPCLLQVGGCRLSLRGDCVMRILVRPLAAVG